MQGKKSGKKKPGGGGGGKKRARYFMVINTIEATRGGRGKGHGVVNANGVNTLPEARKVGRGGTRLERGEAGGNGYEGKRELK